MGDGSNDLEFFGHEAREDLSRSWDFAGSGGGATLGGSGEEDGAAGGTGGAGGGEEVEVEDVTVDELFGGEVGC